MNARMKELADQCTSYNDSDGWIFDKAKFADSIIEECAKRSEAYAYMSPNFNALAEELRRMKESQE